MKKIIPLLFIVCLLTSCLHNSKLYYESPFSGNTIKYYAIPLLRDSAKTATYCDFNIYSGFANDNELDKCDYTSYHLHQARTIKNFQLYYGIDFLFGDYITQKLADAYIVNNNYKAFELGEGKKKFYAYGFQTGTYYTHSINKDFEWRMIGLEYSYKKEAGGYLDFRKNLADSTTSINLTDGYIHSIGLSTEAVVSLKSITGGFKIGYGLILNKSYLNPKYYDYYDASPLRKYDYFLVNGNITYKKITFNWQFNFGKFTKGISSGLTYRL